MSMIPYPHKGLTKTAMKTTGKTARQKEYYDRKPATGTYTCLDMNQRIVVAQIENGAFLIGSEEKGEALAKALQDKYAGNAKLDDGAWVYYNADWAAKCNNGLERMIKEYIAEVLFL